MRIARIAMEAVPESRTIQLRRMACRAYPKTPDHDRVAGRRAGEQLCHEALGERRGGGRAQRPDRSPTRSPAPR
jgi:hypothetical protein